MGLPDTPTEAYAIEATTDISESDLVEIEKKYKEFQLTETLSADIEFEYAWALVRSPYRKDRVRGAELLERLRKTFPKRSRDCMYYLAVGYYRLKDYNKASECIRVLLEGEPSNKQFTDIKNLVDKAVRKEGFIGASLIGGFIFASAAVAVSFLFGSGGGASQGAGRKH